MGIQAMPGLEKISNVFYLSILKQTDLFFLFYLKLDLNVFIYWIIIL